MVLVVVGCGLRLRDPSADVVLRRIAYLDPGSPDSRPREIDALRDQLRELGYGEGHNLVIDYRYAFGVAEQLGPLAAELVGLEPEVIVAFGTQSIEAARDASESAGTPIVMASSSDPVGSNLVQTLARPGGRTTGLTSAAPQLTGKRLQLLAESFPRISRVAYLWDSRSSGDHEERVQLELAAARLGLALIPLDVLGSSQRFDVLFAHATDSQADALITFASGLINNYPAPIVSSTRQRSIPAMYAQREFVTEHGGLMAYGPSYPDMYRRTAIFVDKILSGAKPSQLPVEKPRRFRFVINQDAARAVQFVMPRPLLVQVDEIV